MRLRLLFFSICYIQILVLIFAISYLFYLELVKNRYYIKISSSSITCVLRQENMLVYRDKKLWCFHVEIVFAREPHCHADSLHSARTRRARTRRALLDGHKNKCERCDKSHREFNNRNVRCAACLTKKYRTGGPADYFAAAFNLNTRTLHVPSRERVLQPRRITRVDRYACEGY